MTEDRRKRWIRLNREKHRASVRAYKQRQRAKKQAEKQIAETANFLACVRFA